MMLLTLLYCSIFACDEAVPAAQEQLSVNDDQLRNRIEIGRQQLQALMSEHDADPQCWKDSIMALMHEQCDALNYDARSVTALKLTLCQLAQRGVVSLDATTCAANPKACIDDIYIANDVTFATYNNFFSQIDNICIYSELPIIKNRLL